MLHRSKAKEPSSLTIVPYTESESAVANAPAPGQSESRGPSPQPMVAPTAQAPAISVLKANRKRVFMGAAAAALLAAGWLGFNYLAAGRFMVTTDDAYVRAYNTTLGAKVAGYVSEFVVDDNVKVRAGDVIARVDDGDYRLAANAARDKIATQEATIERFDRQIDAHQANARTIDRQPRPGRCFRAERRGRARRRHRQRQRIAGATEGSCPRPRGAQDGARQSRTRPDLHGDPRAGRWRDWKPRRAGRRFRADGAAHRGAGAAVGRLHRCQFQGNPACPTAARTAGLDQDRCLAR